MARQHVLRRGLVLLGVVSLAALAVAVQAAPATSVAQRHAVSLSNEEDLLEVFAAGLTGDAFGYDANEVLYLASTVKMPSSDILPAFYVSFLSGTNIMQVISQRTQSKTWGEIAEAQGVTADALNRLSIPEQVQITAPKDMPDSVLQDLFVCSAVSQVFNLHPDEVFGYYQQGWLSRDVLAAAEIGYRTGRGLDAYLKGSLRRVDWFQEARGAGISMAEVARYNGRCFDNQVPLVSGTPQRGDVETLYATELVTRNWSVPAERVQYARWRYLYTPSELLIAFYVGDLAGVAEDRVGRLYAWDNWRRWSLTLADLKIPASRLVDLPVFRNGRVDLENVDEDDLSRALLSAALATGADSNVRTEYLYTHIDEHFWPSDAILYCGVYWHYGVAFGDYYDWCWAGRPWWSFPYFGRDFGRLPCYRDWDRGRHWGFIMGDMHPGPRPYEPWHPRPDRGPSFIRGDRQPMYRPEGPGRPGYRIDAGPWKVDKDYRPFGPGQPPPDQHRGFIIGEKRDPSRVSPPPGGPGAPGGWGGPGGPGGPKGQGPRIDNPFGRRSGKPEFGTTSPAPIGRPETGPGTPSRPEFGGPERNSDKSERPSWITPTPAPVRTPEPGRKSEPVTTTPNRPVWNVPAPGRNSDKSERSSWVTPTPAPVRTPEPIRQPETVITTPRQPVWNIPAPGRSSDRSERSGWVTPTPAPVRTPEVTTPSRPVWNTPAPERKTESPSRSGWDLFRPDRGSGGNDRPNWLGGGSTPAPSVSQPSRPSFGSVFGGRSNDQPKFSAPTVSPQPSAPSSGPRPGGGGGPFGRRH